MQLRRSGELGHADTGGWHVPESEAGVQGDEGGRSTHRRVTTTGLAHLTPVKQQTVLADGAGGAAAWNTWASLQGGRPPCRGPGELRDIWAGRHTHGRCWLSGETGSIRIGWEPVLPGFPGSKGNTSNPTGYQLISQCRALGTRQSRQDPGVCQLISNLRGRPGRAGARAAGRDGPYWGYCTQEGIPTLTAGEDEAGRRWGRQEGSQKKIRGHRGPHDGLGAPWNWQRQQER